MSIKRLLVGCVGILCGGILFAYAQNPALTRLFELLDAALAQNPGLSVVLIEKLDAYETPTISDNKRSLIQEIRSYIQSKNTQQNENVAFVPPVPPGYKVLPQARIDSILGAIHIKGDETAPIIVMEFLDFQCPYCKKQHDNSILGELRDVEYPGKVRTAAVMFPLTGKRHELATQAAESAECAFVQGGNDVFYAHKAGLYAYGLKPTMHIIRTVAQNNGLDPERMQACIDEGHTSQAVQNQKQIGRSLGVSGTPGSVILDTRNGAYKTIRGAVPIEVFMDIVKQLYTSK